MLNPSIRNTVEAQQLLFQRVGCKLVVYASALEKSLKPLFDSMPDLRSGSLQISTHFWTTASLLRITSVETSVKNISMTQSSCFTHLAHQVS